MSRRDLNNHETPAPATPASKAPKADEPTELKVKLDKANAELKAKTDSLARANSEIAELKTALEKAGKSKSDAQRLVEDLSKTNAELQAKLERAAAALKELDELKKRNKELSDRLDDTAKELASQEAAKKPTGTKTTVSAGLGMLSGKEQTAVLEQIDVARAAAKAISGYTDTARARDDMLQRLLG